MGEHQVIEDAIREADEGSESPSRSVLQDWVMKLPLRQQGVLVLALRGPDGAAKEDKAKPIVRALRAIVMVSGREGRPMAHGQSFRDDAFMSMAIISNPHKETGWPAYVNSFFESIDQYNIHFVQHLTHAFQIAGVMHHDDLIRKHCDMFYHRMVHHLHFQPESPSGMIYRLRDGRREEADDPGYPKGER